MGLRSWLRRRRSSRVKSPPPEPRRKSLKLRRFDRLEDTLLRNFPFLLSTKVFKSTLESLLLRPRPAESAARCFLTASSSSLRSICLPRLSALRAGGSLRVLRVEETDRLLELRL